MSVSVEVTNPHLSRITLCEVEIRINGKIRLLRPTLRGVLTICKAGGFEHVIRGLLNEDFDCATAAVLAGLSWKQDKKEKIDEWIWKEGLKNTDLISNLIDFLENLQRGGKLPLDARAISPQTQEESSFDLLTFEQWADNLYMIGTGWLGWRSDEVLDTTLGALQLAIEGKLDCVKRTNPFGSGEDDKNKMQRDIEKERPNPQLAAQQIQAFFRRKIANQQREAKNKTK